MDRLTYKTNGKYTNTIIEQAPPYAIDCNIDTAIAKLAEYEDLEEQGKLLKLPCSVGDTVYHLYTLKNGESEIIEMTVGCVEPCGAIRNHKGICEVWNVYAETDYSKGYFKFFDFGKTVFLTGKEAESALQKIMNIRATINKLQKALIQRKE